VLKISSLSALIATLLNIASVGIKYPNTY
jgi:hypothetical protein